MVNFDTLVQNILLNEAVVGVPDWFNTLLVKHKELFSVDITDEDLNDFFNLLDDTRISETEGLKDLNKIRILDLMKTFYDSMSPKPKDLNEFKTNITDNSDKFKNKISNILTLNKSNRLNWKMSNSKIIELKQRSKKLAGQKGADTLMGEYGNDFIIPAVQKIVKKRVDFFTRVLNFKSPTTPFTNLITDVFKYPLQYKSGAKKYTSDFEEVDKFYIDNLIEIALAAQDFYVKEMTQLKLAKQNNAGLNLFELIVGQILNEQTPGSVSIGRGGETTTSSGLVVPSSYKPSDEKPTTTQPVEIPKEVINKLKEEILSEQQIPNKINFYLGKSIDYNLTNPETGENTDKVLQTVPGNYKVNQLQKNPNAKTLIQSLTRVAEYTKKKPGAGERMKQLGNAADATLAAMGVKLYG